jgi:predicted AAA+ superfamily ATPase
MANVLSNGELPTLKHFIQPARKVRTYLSAMENIFLLRKINCHASGTGKEVWMFMDSGLATHLMGTSLGEGVTLSLVRQFIWNELCVQAEYQGQRLSRTYYKSAQGSPIDFVIHDIPFRIVHMGWRYRVTCRFRVKNPIVLFQSPVLPRLFLESICARFFSLQVVHTRFV